MEIAGSHVSIIFLSFLIHVTSPFHLGDYRHSKLQTFSSRRNDHLSYLGAKTRQFDETQGRKENGKDKRRNQAPSTGTFVNCVFKVGRENQPEYDCKHSENVKINWTREASGLLMGTFSTKFHCPTRREVRSTIPTPRNAVGGEKWKLVIRDKRKTIWRDDYKVIDDWDKAEEPDVDQDEYDIEDSEAQSTEDEYELTDTEGSMEVIEEDKRRKAAFRRAKGTVDILPTFRQDNAGESTIEEKTENEEQEEKTDDVTAETTDDVTEEKKDDVTDNADEEIPAQQIVDSEPEGDPEESKEIAETEKETVDETSSEDKNDDKLNENNESGDEESADGTDAPEETVDKPEVEKAEEPDSNEKDADKPPGDKPPIDKPPDKAEVADKSDGTTKIAVKLDSAVDIEDSILFPIQVDIGLIVSESKLPLITALLQDLLLNVGDYILSSFMAELRRRLRQARIEDKFNRKVEILAKSSNNDADKALQIMKKKIREQLGKPYQLEIVKLLNQLYDDWTA